MRGGIRLVGMLLRMVLWQGTYEQDHEDEVGAPADAVDEDW